MVRSIFKKVGAQPDEVLQKLQNEIDRLPKVSGGIGQVYLSQRTNQLFEKALKSANKLRDEFISVEHLLLALCEDSGAAGRLLKEQGLSENVVLQVLQNYIKRSAGQYDSSG